MKCMLCVKDQNTLTKWGSLIIRMPQIGIIELSSICENCQSKIIDFLKSIGWKI